MTNLHLIKKFSDELSKVNGQCHLFDNVSQAVNEINNFCINENIKKIVINNQDDISKKINEMLKKNSNLIVETTEEIRNRNNDLKEELKYVDLGISVANYLIAETGTVMLVSSLAEPRTLSLVPEFNIVLAKAESVVEKIEDALKNIEDVSCITLITGPSRTADIEKILVTGVHGPKKFSVFIFNS